MKRSLWAQSHYDRLAHDPEYLTARLMIEVNEQLAQRMQEKGISQRALSALIGKTQPFLSRLFSSGTNVTLRTLVTLANALNAEFIPPRLIGREKIATVDKYYELVAEQVYEGRLTKPQIDVPAVSGYKENQSPVQPIEGQGFDAKFALAA
jgi:transcriptional regulator with XRE-family HTH domain